MKKSLCLVILCLTFVYSSAQAPKYSNEFLAIGVGARALGMSNSVVASADDATAAYWNPAGLVLVPAERQLSFMHAEYFAGIAKYDYIGLVANIENRAALGFSFIRFAVDNIPNTTDLIDAQGNIDYDRITTFTAADNAFLISYARKMPVENLRVGGNVKIIRRKVGDFGGSWGFGIDLAAQYKLNQWKFGAIFRDATSTFNAWSFTLDDQTRDVFILTGNEIPENSLELTLPRLILGTGRTFNISNSFTLYPEANMDITFDGKRNVLIKSDPISIDPHLGFELSYKGFAYFRAGIGNVQQITSIAGKRQMTFQPNMGLGINIRKTFSIDYALTDIGDQSVALYSHVFSLRLNFNRTGSKSSI